MRDGKTARRQDGKRIVGATLVSPASRPNPSAREHPSSPTPGPEGTPPRVPGPSERGERSRERRARASSPSSTGEVVAGESKRHGVGGGEGNHPSSPQPTPQDSPSRRLA